MGGSSSKKKMEQYLLKQGTVKHWGVVHTCAFSEWTKHQAVLWGCNPCVNYSTRQDSRFQAWATNGRYFVAQIPAPETQDIDMSASRMYATMAIEEKRNKYQVQCVDLPYSYFKDGVLFVEVIGYREKKALVQVATKHQRMDFLLVDTDRDLVTVIYRESTTHQPYLCEAAISPDYSRVLLKPSHYYCHFHNAQGVKDKINFLEAASLNSRPNKKPHGETDSESRQDFSLYENESFGLAMTFDPRFRHSRIVLANVIEDNRPVILVYDTEKQMKVMKNYLHTNLERSAQQIVFSPGGNFIAVPMICGTFRDTPPFTIIEAKLFNANTLECVHVLPYKGTPGSYLNLIPVSVFPIFSSSGAFLALPVSKSHPESHAYQRALCRVGSVAIHKVAPLMHLQSMCRSRIRQFVARDKLAHLPLPEAMKRFLLFMPYLD